DHQRDELFREVVGPVVVGAVGDDHRQARSALPGPGQVVGGGLAGGVGGAGGGGGALGDEAAVVGQVAVDLVGGDVVEAKACPGVVVETAPVAAAGLQQAVGADDIGVDEGRGAVDGAVHMALRRQVHHPVGAVLGE